MIERLTHARWWTLLTVVGIIMSVAVAGWAVERRLSETRLPQHEVVSLFINDLNQRRWPAAYGLLSSDSLSNVTPESLASWRNRKIPSGINASSYRVKDLPKQSFNVRIEADDGTVTNLYVTILRERGQWKLSIAPSVWGAT